MSRRVPKGANWIPIGTRLADSAGLDLDHDRSIGRRWTRWGPRSAPAEAIRPVRTWPWFVLFLLFVDFLLWNAPR